MPTYLEIAVNVPQVEGVFHYHLLPGMEGQVGAGHLVVVPFGRHKVQGVVLRQVDEPAVLETRPVLELVDPAPVLTPLQLSLARLLSDTHLSTLATFISLMLPPGLSQQSDIIYSLTNKPLLSSELSEGQVRVLKLLQKRGPLRGSQLDQALKQMKWRPAANALIRRGLITARSSLPPPTVQAKFVRTAQLACPPEIACEALPDLGRAGSQALERRQGMLRFLIREPGPVDAAWVYAESGGTLADLRYLAERGLVVLGESEVWRDPLDGISFQPNEAPPLTGDQQEVWAKLQKQIQAAAGGQVVPPILLHGVTGSGKTEIYLRALDETFRLGKQAIILVPEIALTPQTVRRFSGRFPGRVGLFHSGLSAGERYDTWRRARAGLLSAVVGPRSALFTPFTNLGLIVVDEFHDDSYYQSEPPFYHAGQAAIACASLSRAVCLLGSATPDLVSTYQASQGGPGRWFYLHLPSRVLAHREAVRAQIENLEAKSGHSQPAPRFQTLEALAEYSELPAVQVVDMRLELQAGNRSIFSRALQSALERVLAEEQQAILFLNRRGAATYVFCRDCGYSLKCPRCDLPLTVHGPQSGLLCHYCNYRRKLPQACPDCGSKQIRQYGAGTERVETELQALFPQVRTLRWDAETTRQKGAHEVLLSHFGNHRADVLVGTQMLAKGLDLPLVTLVGVVLADVGLSLPDYRASERTFQVLTQVAGRAGRSPLGGQVILQTFLPDHYVIQAAAGHDYKSFYRQELEYRRRLGYPPFSRLVRLEYRHADAEQAERAAFWMASQLRAWLTAEDRRATQMIGPAPCFFARQAGLYRWQIILRGPDPASLLKGRPLGEWRVEVNPSNLL